MSVSERERELKQIDIAGLLRLGESLFRSSQNEELMLEESLQSRGLHFLLAEEKELDSNKIEKLSDTLDAIEELANSVISDISATGDLSLKLKRFVDAIKLKVKALSSRRAELKSTLEKQDRKKFNKKLPETVSQGIEIVQIVRAFLESVKMLEDAIPKVVLNLSKNEHKNAYIQNSLMAILNEQETDLEKDLSTVAQDLDSKMQDERTVNDLSKSEKSLNSLLVKIRNKFASIVSFKDNSMLGKAATWLSRKGKKGRIGAYDSQSFVEDLGNMTMTDVSTLVQKTRDERAEAAEAKEELTDDVKASEEVIEKAVEDSAEDDSTQDEPDSGKEEVTEKESRMQFREGEVWTWKTDKGKSIYVKVTQDYSPEPGSDYLIPKENNSKFDYRTSRWSDGYSVSTSAAARGLKKVERPADMFVESLVYERWARMAGILND